MKGPTCYLPLAHVRACSVMFHPLRCGPPIFHHRSALSPAARQSVRCGCVEAWSPHETVGKSPNFPSPVAPPAGATGGSKPPCRRAHGGARAALPTWCHIYGSFDMSVGPDSSHIVIKWQHGLVTLLRSRPHHPWRVSSICGLPGPPRKPSGSTSHYAHTAVRVAARSVAREQPRTQKALGKTVGLAPVHKAPPVVRPARGADRHVQATRKPQRHAKHGPASGVHKLWGNARRRKLQSRRVTLPCSVVAHSCLTGAWRQRQYGAWEEAENQEGPHPTSFVGEVGQVAEEQCGGGRMPHITTNSVAHIAASRIRGDHLPTRARPARLVLPYRPATSRVFLCKWRARAEALFPPSVSIGPPVLPHPTLEAFQHVYHLPSCSRDWLPSCSTVHPTRVFSPTAPPPHS